MTSLPTVTPRVDVYRSEDAILLIADLPGVRAEDLDLQVEGATLKIEARWSPERPGEPSSREFAPGHYRRSFSLPPDADTESITADRRDGVLHVRVPRRAPPVRTIRIG